LLLGIRVICENPPQPSGNPCHLRKSAATLRQSAEIRGSLPAIRVIRENPRQPSGNPRHPRKSGNHPAIRVIRENPRQPSGNPCHPRKSAATIRRSAASAKIRGNLPANPCHPRKSAAGL
jgi:hypothetical protein